VSAPILALLLASCMGIATPWLLRWIPAPPEAPDVDFTVLDFPRFSLAVFVLIIGIGTPVFLLTEPQYWPVWAPLTSFGVLLGLIDSRTTFLPMRLHYLGFALTGLGAVATAWWVNNWALLAWATLASLAVTGLYWAIWRLSGGQLGFGDVRLAGLLAFATATISMELLFWSFLAGSVVGAVWALATRIRGRTSFAYGPSMLLGVPLGLAIAAMA
jgi:leader peptidase (prepilin peptidase) / N-methyltransferase